MCDFAKEDVLALARAILEDPVITVSGDGVSYLFCRYCDAELHGFQYSAKDFKHDLGCPVIIAQDALKRNGA